MGSITFPKIMIFLCLVGSGALGYFDWKQTQEIAKLKEALRPNGWVETTVRETQKLGKQYAELSKALSGDALVGQESPLTYIAEIADKPKIDIGEVDIQPSERPGSRTTNTIDKEYVITPAKRDRAYPKMSIANFLFTLEDKSPRIRVTSLTLNQLNRDNPRKTRVKPTEYPSDLFTFSATVTSRQRKE